MGDQVVLGVGNRDRGDDAAGLDAVESLSGRVPEGVDLISGDGDPSWVIDAFEGRRLAVVLDAVRSGSAPGSVVVFDATASPLPATTRLWSSHAMGVGAAIELARALDRLPDRLVVVGIEAEADAPGTAPSAAVTAGASRAAEVALEVIGDA